MKAERRTSPAGRRSGDALRPVLPERVHAAVYPLSFFGRWSRPAVVSTGVLLIGGIAFADWLTGPDLRFYIFYWPPIALMAWCAGRGSAYAAVVLSTVGSALANGSDWGAQHGLLLIWNIGVTFVSFAFLAYLVSELRHLVDFEREMARTDFLTGLPNTRAFYEALATELTRSRRSHSPVSLAYIDIDDFKQLNDRLGHGAGDSTLRQIAQKIRGSLRAPDMAARLGGDEFATFFPETGPAEVQAAVGRLRAGLLETIAAAKWGVSVSIGAVTCLDGTCSADDLVRDADNLMYEAKKGGKNAARFAVLASGGTSDRDNPGP